MTYQELATEIISLDFSITYGSYIDPPALPYTIIIGSDDNDVKADNHNYVKIRGHQLEYYNDKRNTADEKAIEDKLDELRIGYAKYGPTPVEDEGMFQTVYVIQLI